MKLLPLLCALIQFFICFTQAIPITHLHDGLFGLVYKCESLETCQKLLVDNTYEFLPQLTSFIQNQDSSISHIEVESLQDSDFENANFIISKSGYFKPSKSGVHGFHFEDKINYSLIQIGDNILTNLSDRSTFWVHLDADTVYNLRIASIVKNPASQISDVTFIDPSGEQKEILSSAFFTHFSDTENNLNILKRDDYAFPEVNAKAATAVSGINVGDNDDNNNNDGNNGNNNHKSASNSYDAGVTEVNYGSPKTVLRQWWDCDNKIFNYTCSGIPTTDVISGITAKMYYTTCVNPPYVIGDYNGGALNYQSFTVGTTTITATLTDWTVGTITCTTPTTLVDPTGSTVTAICSVFPSEVLYSVNYVQNFDVTSCDFPVGISATFLATSHLTSIDPDVTSYITDTNVPTFSTVTKTSTLSDPAGNLGDGICTIQLETFDNAGPIVSAPTTICDMPTNLQGEVLSSASTVTFPDVAETFTITNYDIFSLSPVNIAISVTNPLDVTTTANCVVSLTSTGISDIILSFPASSCTMPDDFNGEFSSTLSTTVVTVGDNTATITITNTNVPLFAPATISLMVTDPIGTVGTATCEVNNVQTDIENSLFVFHTTTCTMPTNIHGTFIENDQETVVTNDGNLYTVTLLNQNLPQYDTVETIITFTNPTGDPQLATCEIGITLFETVGTTVGVPVTTCLASEGGVPEFDTTISLTTVSFNDQLATLTVTNVAVPKFNAVILTRTVTDPTGLKREATCDVNFADAGIATTSCTMPTDIKGTFSPTLSSTTVTAEGTTSVVTVTNYVDPYFDQINQMLFVLDPTGSTRTATCGIGMTTIDSSFLIPSTSCAMESTVDAEFIEQESTSVITRDGVESTLTVVHSNVAMFSPVTSLVTVRDLAGNSSPATCAIEFTSATVESSTVSIPTTSCEMPSGIAASFFAKTKTTEVTVNDVVQTLTVTDLAVPTYFAVEQSLVLVNPQGQTTEATCEVAITGISVSETTVDITTTSCSMPQDFGGEFVDALTTTVVTISDSPATVTITNANAASFAPAEIIKTMTDPTGAALEATCLAQFSKISVSASTVSALTTSCVMPTDIAGTFNIRTVSTDLVVGDITTSAILTNVDAPEFSAVFTTIDVTNPAGTTGDATCAIDFTFAVVAEATVSIPTTSCELGTVLTGKFITSISTTVITEGDVTTTLEVTNTNQPSFLAEEAYVTPVTNSDGDSIDATCEVGLTSFTVPGTTLAIPTTSCEFPEDVIGSYEYVYSTTIFSTGSFTTTIVVTNSILGTEWTRAYKTVTSSTTFANDVCAYETSTITNPPVRGTVVEMIAVATPAAYCPVTTRTVENSVCSMTTITSAKFDADSANTVYEELVLTPAKSCNIIYTTLEGTGCESSTHTSQVVTYVGSSRVNATLIVVETPDRSACLSSSHVFLSSTLTNTKSGVHSSASISSALSSDASSSQSGAATGDVKSSSTRNDTANTDISTIIIETESLTLTSGEGHTATARRTQTVTVTCTKTVCTHVPVIDSDVTVTEEDVVVVTMTCFTNSEGSVVTITGGHTKTGSENLVTSVTSDHTLAGTNHVEPTETLSSLTAQHTPSSSSKGDTQTTVSISDLEGSAPDIIKGRNSGFLVLFTIFAVLF